MVRQESLKLFIVCADFQKAAKQVIYSILERMLMATLPVQT